MPVDLDALESLAKSATAGPWVVRTAEYTIATLVQTKHIAREIATEAIHPESQDHAPIVATVHRIAVEEWARYGVHMSAEDAAYIAAANPAVILALIERLREAEATRALQME